MESDDGPAPDVNAREAFALLGHEIRLDILLALVEDWVAVYTEPKSYAELMDAVGVRDSGKFNYHLDKLRGVYVRKVDGGYVPTASATALYRAVLAHRPTETFAFDSTAVESACPACGSRPILRYDRGFASLDCKACSDWIGFTFPLPQRAFDGREPDSLLAVVDRRVRHHLGIASAGQCPDCAGGTSVDLRVEAVDDEHWIELDCDTCTFVAGIDVLSAMVTDDQVASALREIGVDPRQYLWELPVGMTRLVSREPTRLAVDLEGATGEVTVVVDDRLALESVTVTDS